MSEVMPTPVVSVVVNEKPKTDWKRHYRNLTAFLESKHLSLQARGFLMYLWSKQGMKSHAFPSLEQLRQEVGSETLVRKLTKELQAKLPGVLTVERGKGRRRNSYKVLAFESWPDTLLHGLITGDFSTAQKKELEAVVPLINGNYMALLKHGTVFNNTSNRERVNIVDVTGQKLRRNSDPTDLATCCRCKKETADWIRVDSGDYFCGMDCIGQYQPVGLKVRQ